MTQKFRRVLNLIRNWDHHIAVFYICGNDMHVHMSSTSTLIYMNRSKDLNLIQFNYTIRFLILREYICTLFVDFAVFIKSWEYKLMSIELLLKFHKVHRCQKNKRDILKSARGASLHFMWILISSVSHNYE